MGNIFSNDKAGCDMALSNGATIVLLSTLILSGSDLAQTEWEQELVTWLAEHDQTIYGLGVVGFDLDEIAWNPADFEQEKAFLLALTDLALRRHRWEVLDYDPPFALCYLTDFRKLVECYTAEMVEGPKAWDWFQPPETLSKCPLHQVFVHANGCLLCHD
ncbi:MAG: hypothetical protein K1Y36_21510 [Blastocatellia bacterium]|nr:hypothetical protein [Blastocatellia bacterium]